MIYDTAVFLTEAEYKTKSGKQIPSVQSITEIYVIAPSSSSPSDELALGNDRIECLQDLSISITAEKSRTSLGFLAETSLLNNLREAHRLVGLTSVLDVGVRWMKQCFEACDWKPRTTCSLTSSLASDLDSSAQN